MKVRLLWLLPLLCACGSSSRLANDTSRDRADGQAHIHWTRPAPIATREVDVERTRHMEGVPTADQCYSTQNSTAISVATLAPAQSKDCLVPAGTLSAALDAVRTTSFSSPGTLPPVPVYAPSSSALTRSLGESDMPHSTGTPNKASVIAPNKRNPEGAGASKFLEAILARRPAVDQFSFGSAGMEDERRMNTPAIIATICLVLGLIARFMLVNLLVARIFVAAAFTLGVIAFISSQSHNERGNTLALVVTVLGILLFLEISSRKEE